MNSSVRLSSYCLLFLAAPVLTAQDDAKPKIVMFDVRDLVAPPQPDAKKEIENAAHGKTGDGVPFMKSIPLLSFMFQREGVPDAAFQPGKIRIEALADYLQRLCQPAFGPGEKIQGRKGTLIVNASPDKLAWIKKIIELNRRHAGTLIHIETQFVEVPAKIFDAHVRPALGPADLRNVVTDAESRALVRKLTKLGVSLLSSPKIANHALSQSHLQTKNQVAYIKGYNVTANGNAILANPIVDVVEDGLSVGFTAALVAPDRVGLDFMCAVAELERPIKTVETSIGKGKPVTIQLPKVTKSERQAKFELRTNQAALLALPATGEKQLLVVVRATAIEPEGK